jgi:hypothetical protein
MKLKNSVEHICSNIMKRKFKQWFKQFHNYQPYKQLTLAIHRTQNRPYANGNPVPGLGQAQKWQC